MKTFCKAFWATAMALSTLSSCTSKENPFFAEWDTPYGIPPFDKISVEDYEPAIMEGMARQNAAIDSIIADTAAPSFENVILAMEKSGEFLTRPVSVLFNLSESYGSDELNAVVEKVTPLLSAHEDDIYMNSDLFAKVNAVREGDCSALGREQQMLLKSYYEAFVNNGVGLDAQSRARIKEINSELSVLTLKFANNLRSEANAFSDSIGFSPAFYYDRMAVESDRALREKIFRAYSGRGANGNNSDNSANVVGIARLRLEKAKLLGYRSYAHFRLHDKMAGNPETVDAFLGKIMAASMKRAKEEIADMQALMDADIKSGLLPEGSRIQPWDYMYYSDRVRRQRYDFDESQASCYFKMENVRAGVFGNASRLYGINFEKMEGVALYHPECEAFKVTDSDGSLIGILITDYYPRESKRGGAWMDSIVPQKDGVRPVVVNVGNFNRGEDGKPSLLSIDQVETMWHEFGHALHGLLSQCAYVSTSGTSVVRDFVELPSQINENWAFQPEVLATYAFHYETGEVIPASIVEKIQAVAHHGEGFSCGELCAASILDMKWHELEDIPQEALDNPAAWKDAFEASVCKEMGLVEEIIPRYRSTYFNHIFGSNGYSAGYYSYLWAEVLDKDAFELFKERGIFDKETAMSFRHNILEAGGSEEPMVLYKRFRGADPDPSALLRARGLE